MRQSIVAAGIALTLLAGAACGDDDDDDAASTTSSTTTSSTTSTTTPASTTAPPTSQQSDLASGPDYNRQDGPSGAGCTPGGSARTLGAGWWAGEVKRVAGTRVDFDLICYFAGEAAIKAAEADGQIATDDYYIRNDNPRTFPETFTSTSAPAMCVAEDNQPFSCTAGDILRLYADGPDNRVDVGGREAFGFPILWIHNSGPGEADFAYVQFSP